jgi:hypothetical protein
VSHALLASRALNRRHCLRRANSVIRTLTIRAATTVICPSGDHQFDHYILNPEPAALENLLYPVLTDTQTSNRQDLLAVFHTGVPGLNTLARSPVP